jgi:zinc protease
MQCIVKAGTHGETDETNGVAALTAALMTRGTEKFTADQIAEYFDSIGGSISADSGRNTLYVSCEVLKDDFAEAFRYFSQVALKPTFPRDEFEDRKAEALLAIGQRRADTFAEAGEFLHDTFPKTTTLRRIIGGRKETVAKLTVDDCRRFHARYFVPQNMVVTVFGDIDPERALALVRETFGALTPAADFTFPTPAGLKLERSITAHKTTQRPDTAVVILAYPSTDFTQDKENAALLVLTTILAGYDGGGGWLFRDLRGAGLVYIVTAANNPSLATGYFSVIAQTRPDQLPEAIRRIKENLAKAARGEFTEEEFHRAKQNILNARARENETLAARAQQAGFDEVLGLGYDHNDQFEEQIKAVTLDDVKRAAKQYLDRYIQVTTGPGKGPP